MDSFPLSRVENSQPAGIGRVAPLRGGCAWNNLGRNVVFADRSLQPVAVFGDTAFPDEDEASQFDLDVHAVVDLPGSGTVAVLNHYGSLRIFGSPWSGGPGPVPEEPNLAEQRQLEFVDDVERVVPLGDHLVTSRQRGRRLDGVLLTEALPSVHERIRVESAHESFGFVSALAAHSTPDGTGWVALGGDGRVRLVEAERGRLGATRWEAPVDFLVAALFGSGPTLWAAGSAAGGTGVDDYRWDELGGGGLAQLDVADGAVLAAARFGEDLAWGSGGVPVALVDGVPCGFGRRGELHVLLPGTAETIRLTDVVSTQALGIAHVAVVGDRLVVGFNRGGYRLRVTATAALSRLVGERLLRRA